MAEPTGVIRPQPRNAALGALADFLQRANTAAARVQFNPQIAPQFTLADLLPLEGAAGLMQDVAAYGPRALIKGGNVATGGIGTFRPDPRILDVAEAAAIGAPVARAAARPVGRMAAQQIERAMTEGRGPLGAALGPVRPLPLDVYHGTPHRFPAEEGAPFGRFNAEKIGTGEGAQAYGHGHYTAEVPEVAKDYQYTLSRIEPEKVTYGGKSVDSMYNSALAEQDRAHRLKDRSAIDKANAKVAFWENVMVRRHPEDVIRTANSEEDGWPEFASYANSLDLGKFKGVADVGSLYKIDLPDESIDKMLDWDKPLSEQPEAVRKAIADAQSIGMFKNIDDRATGAQIYNASIGESGGGQRGEEASRMLREMGIPGIKYLDQVSRNKPLKDIRREFLNELPEDAGLDEVVSLLGTGTFSPKNEAIIKALAENDWLGFDYPSQALSTALSPSLNNYDFSSSLMRAVNSAQEGGTRNFVVFPGNEDLLRIIERNNEKLPESSPGYAEGGAVSTDPEGEDRMVQQETAATSEHVGYATGGAVNRAARSLDELAERYAGGGAVRKGIKGLVEKYTKRAPQDEALETARKNAVTMLGLPENNTAMDRARAMGYVDDVKGELYRGQHQAPISSIEIASPAYELNRNTYPDDIYSSKAARYYGHGSDPVEDANVMRRLQALKNSPDAPVVIFRAVPKNVSAGRINHGDWVTPSKAYAIEHGQTMFGKDYKILRDRVPAKSLYTDGNSIYEFGYDKSQRFAEGPASIPIVRNPNPANSERSRFAAFDPARINEADLLGFADPRLLGLTAAGTAAGLGLRPLFARDEEKQEPQKKAEGGIVRSEFEYDPAAVDARAAALMEEIDAA